MKTIHRTLFLTTATLLAACAQTDPGSSPAHDPAPVTDVGVSGSALAIEKAERILDRGGDATDAGTLLDGALANPDLTAEERVAAVVAKSRVHEALDQAEEAIAVIERELAAHVDERRFPVGPLRTRLKELLVDDDTLPKHVDQSRNPTPPFARMLGKYFPADDNGAVHIEIFAVGGDHDVHEDVGTFNISDAMRAQLQDECPLCDIDLDVHNSVHGGDWVMIPQVRDQLGDALVVLYYDLERHRIPARYASLLPMDIDELERTLSEGKGLFAAKERPGAPPVVLIAAPRSAMLIDVEKQVAMLDTLPTEPRAVDVNDDIRPDEIRAIVRGGWIPEVRACYEALRQTAPEAEGRVVAKFAVVGDGSVQRASVSTEDAALDVGSFLSCVEDGVTKLSFPAIGRETTISYPLVLNTK